MCCCRCCVSVWFERLSVSASGASTFTSDDLTVLSLAFCFHPCRSNLQVSDALFVLYTAIPAVVSDVSVLVLHAWYRLCRH